MSRHIRLLVSLTTRSWKTPSFRAVLGCAAAAIGSVAVALGQAPPPSSTPESIARAEQVLADGKALGGEKLAGIKTLVATGHTRRVRGDNLVPIEFEILIELPDKYVRIDEFPAEDTDPTSSGFNGDAWIQIPPPSAGPIPGRGMPGPPGAAAAPPAAPGAKHTARRPRGLDIDQPATSRSRAAITEARATVAGAPQTP